MTGVELFTYIKRRLLENNLTLEADRDAELYDYATEGRNELLTALATASPVVVQQIVTLDVAAAVYSIPAASKDPIRKLKLRDKATRRPLDPSSSLDQDAGDYEWESDRSLRISAVLAAAPPASGIELLYVPSPAAAITSATTEPNIGVPIPCHRAVGKYAAILALTADEESDATAAMGLFQRELDRLKPLYGDLSQFVQMPQLSAPSNK